MTSTAFMLLPLVTLLWLSGLGCVSESRTFPLSLQTVERLSPINTKHLSYAERRGRWFVSVTDRSGDCHVHQLDVGNASRQQTIEVLRRKAGELAAANSQAAPTSPPGPQEGPAEPQHR